MSKSNKNLMMLWCLTKWLITSGESTVSVTLPYKSSVRTTKQAGDGWYIWFSVIFMIKSQSSFLLSRVLFLYIVLCYVIVFVYEEVFFLFYLKKGIWKDIALFEIRSLCYVTVEESESLGFISYNMPTNKSGACLSLEQVTIARVWQ